MNHSLKYLLRTKPNLPRRVIRNIIWHMVYVWIFFLRKKNNGFRGSTLNSIQKLSVKNKTPLTPDQYRLHSQASTGRTSRTNGL